MNTRLPCHELLTMFGQHVIEHDPGAARRTYAPFADHPAYEDAPLPPADRDTWSLQQHCEHARISIEIANDVLRAITRRASTRPELARVTGWHVTTIGKAARALLAHGDIEVQGRDDYGREILGATK